MDNPPVAGFFVPGIDWHDSEGKIRKADVTTTSGSSGASRSLTQIPRGIWVLGFVSMLMDVSSEMIHALLPVYLVTVLGTSATTVGFIEGIAEATASITKIKESHFPLKASDVNNGVDAHFLFNLLLQVIY